MELQDFIKDTISDAASELQEALGPKGVLANPQTNGRGQTDVVKGYNRHHHRLVKDVELDVVPTVRKSGSVCANAKIAIIEANVCGEMSGSSQQVSRLKLLIPMALKATDYRAISNDVWKHLHGQARCLNVMFSKCC